MGEERSKWGNQLEFILTVIGFAVGLGAVWRFPYLVFANGGATFVIIFFLMLFLVGIPIFFLELSLGQFSGLGPTHAFYRICPISQGVGYAGLMIIGYIGFYYNVIISYSLYYLVMSMRGKLLWSTCDNPWNTGDCASRNKSLNCSEYRALYPNPKSPSEEYFYRKVLNLSDGIGNLGQFEVHLVIALLCAWIIVFLALSKGIQTLGKISYFTATFPYIMLTILVVAGALLEGSGIGMEFYIGKIDGAKFYEPGVWKDATVQIFYALSACQGGLISMSSLNPFRNNIWRDSLLIPILDCLTGLYAGFAIFTVLGYMSISKCALRFQDVVATGPELAFIVYPEGLSLMKVVPPLWSIMFFLMMLALGFGSQFSFMETIMIMILDVFREHFLTKTRQIIMRLCVCVVFFLGSLCMTTQGGFFILSLINEYTAGYPLLIVGLLETIVLPWIYGTKNMRRDIECMIGPKPNWFWMIWTVLWRFVCPIALLLVIIATAVFGSNPLVVNNITFPHWAHVIGYLISASPIAVIVICAIIQIYRYRSNWRALFSPDDAYYDNYRNYLSSLEEFESGKALDKEPEELRYNKGIVPLKDVVPDGKSNPAFNPDDWNSETKVNRF